VGLVRDGFVVGCISNSRSRGTRADSVLEPKTLEMFSRVVGFPFVANAGVLFLHGVSTLDLVETYSPGMLTLSAVDWTPKTLLPHKCSHTPAEDPGLLHSLS